MAQQDAQRSEIHETTADADTVRSGQAPAGGRPDRDRKEEPETGIVDTDLKPAQDDGDVGGPVKVSSDDIRPKRA